MSAHERAVEAREIVQKLHGTSFGPLIRTLQAEPDCFCNNGRPNAAAIARYMGIEAPRVREMLSEVRALPFGG